MTQAMARAVTTILAASLLVAGAAGAATSVVVARKTGGAVSLTWDASGSPGLGYNVWRETGSDRVKVNERLIPGEVFLTAPRLAPRDPFHWEDRAAGLEPLRYWIEHLASNGTSSFHGPFPAHRASAPLAIAADGIIAPPPPPGDDDGGFFVSDPGLGAPATASRQLSLRRHLLHLQIAGRGGVKAMVRTEGWYRVTGEELQEAGFEPGGDSRRIALYADGGEIPLVMNDGGDHRFDLADSLEFWGVGIDTPSSGRRAYWIVDKGSRGSRFARIGPGARRAVATSTPFTFQRIERNLYFPALVDDAGRDPFFGAIVSPAPVTQDLEVEHIVPGSAASLEIVLQGATEIEHTVALELNGHDLGEVEVSGYANGRFTIGVPPGVLLEGSNTLELTSLGGDWDVLVVEALRLTWQRELVASDDALKVVVRGGTVVTVRGFTSDSIRVIDVTNPDQPIFLARLVSADGGSFRASFIPPTSKDRTVVVIGDSRVASPAALVEARPTALHMTGHDVDYLVIAAAGLADAVQPLADHHDGNGLSTLVVPVEDVINEFNFGVYGPEAVRKFLGRTRAWDTAPRFVLLAGDASGDPRNYLGLGTFASVPTKTIQTVFGKAVSDDWFADFTDSGLPEMAIGRLPGRTAGEIELMTGKILERDTSSNRVALIAGANDENDFEGSTATLAATVPVSFDKDIIQIGQIANDSEAIEDAFDSLLLTYSGHGSNNYWLSGPTGQAQFSSFSNGPTLPVVVGMTCLNASFHDFIAPSMAESLLLNDQGGAVAVWTSSAFTLMVPQIPMGVAMLESLFDGATIGEAAMESKSATDDIDVRLSWVLIGDPAMPLR